MLILYGNKEFVKWKLCEFCGKLVEKVEQNCGWIWNNKGSKNYLSYIMILINKTSLKGGNIKKKIIIGVVILLLIAVGVWIFLNKKTNNQEYVPQEEISDEQLIQTIVSLYFKNKNTGELESEGRLIDAKLLLNEPYKTLMELLIEGPKNEKFEATIPNGTKINKMELKNDILYIDFSKEFVDNQKNGTEEESATIYSIVNTMTRLTEINGVKILIDGKADQKFKDGKINFSDTFVKIK